MTKDILDAMYKLSILERSIMYEQSNKGENTTEAYLITCIVFQKK